MSFSPQSADCAGSSSAVAPGEQEGLDTDYRSAVIPCRRCPQIFKSNHHRSRLAGRSLAGQRTHRRHRTDPAHTGPRLDTVAVAVAAGRIVREAVHHLGTVHNRFAAADGGRRNHVRPVAAVVDCRIAAHYSLERTVEGIDSFRSLVGLVGLVARIRLHSGHAGAGSMRVV